MRQLLSLALLGCMVVSPAFADDSDKTTLNITAQADVKAAPDIATISSGVITVAPTADVALRENSKLMNEVFTALKKAGIDDKDMQTSGITINPQYVYEEKKSPKITGYQANNSLSIIIRDLKKIGPVLDTLVAKGSNQIDGPNFTIENSDPLLDKARAEAVAKARARANLYAKAVGMKVKRLINLSESHYSQPVPIMGRNMKMMAMAADASAPTPIAAGQVNMTVNVNVVYELE